MVIPVQLLGGDKATLASRALAHPPPWDCCPYPALSAGPHGLWEVLAPTDLKRIQKWKKKTAHLSLESPQPLCQMYQFN